MGSFFYGYLLSQIPGALLASKWGALLSLSLPLLTTVCVCPLGRFGGKFVLVSAVALWSLCTLMTPLLSGASMACLLACRIALGLFEGVFFPAAHHFLSGHVPASERSRAMGVINTGNSLGTVIAFFVCPWLSDNGYGWQSSFYLVCAVPCPRACVCVYSCLPDALMSQFGIAGLVWSVVWCFVAVDAPPPPTEEKADGEVAPEGRWAFHTQFALAKTMLSTPACLAIFYCHFANNVGGYIVLSWLPTFISKSWGVSMNHLSLSFLPYACTAVAVNLGSYWADRMISAGVDVSKVRKTMTSFAFLGAGSLYLLFWVFPTSSLSLWQAMALICMAMSMQTCNQSG